MNQCICVTKKGTRCRNRVKVGLRCHLHKTSEIYNNDAKSDCGYDCKKIVKKIVENDFDKHKRLWKMVSNEFLLVNKIDIKDQECFCENEENNKYMYLRCCSNIVHIDCMAKTIANGLSSCPFCRKNIENFTFTTDKTLSKIFNSSEHSKLCDTRFKNTDDNIKNYYGDILDILSEKHNYMKHLDTTTYRDPDPGLSIEMLLVKSYNMEKKIAENFFNKEKNIEIKKIEKILNKISTKVKK